MCLGGLDSAAGEGFPGLLRIWSYIRRPGAWISKTAGGWVGVGCCEPHG